MGDVGVKSRRNGGPLNRFPCRCPGQTETISAWPLRHEWQRRLERDLSRIPLYRLTRPQNPDKIGTHPFLRILPVCTQILSGNTRRFPRQMQQRQKKSAQSAYSADAFLHLLTTLACTPRQSVHSNPVRKHQPLSSPNAATSKKSAQSAYSADAFLLLTTLACILFVLRWR